MERGYLEVLSIGSMGHRSQVLYPWSGHQHIHLIQHTNTIRKNWFELTHQWLSYKPILTRHKTFQWVNKGGKSRVNVLKVYSDILLITNDWPERVPCLPRWDAERDTGSFRDLFLWDAWSLESHCETQWWISQDCKKKGVIFNIIFQEHPFEIHSNKATFERWWWRFHGPVLIHNGLGG